MEFAIATIEFWEKVGFNTDGWRKSVDGKYALVHLEYALILVDRDDENIDIYRSNDPDFKELLNSELWSESITEEGGEIDGEVTGE